MSKGKHGQRSRRSHRHGPQPQIATSPGKQKKRLSTRRLFLSNRSIAILSIIAAITTSFIIYYLAYGAPDLRFVAYSHTQDQPPNLVDEHGRCLYYMTSKTRFTNLSLKTGFINEIRLSPLTTDAAFDFKVISIDKTPIRYGEEKDIEYKISLALDAAYCRRIHDTGITFKSFLFFYDNAGNQINDDTNGQRSPYEFNFELVSSTPQPSPNQ